MLKFFRQYNKHILVVGGCLLMVSFLIEPALNQCQQAQFEETIGHLDGREITTTDLRRASDELGVLRRLQIGGGYDPLQWILLQHDARKMGLSASRREASELIALAGITNVALNDAMQEYGMTSSELLDAVRSFLIERQYYSMAMGENFTSIAQTAKNRQKNVFDLPAPPVSEPMVKRLLYDQRAEVTITAVEVPASTYQTEIKPPTETEKKELFEKYKEVLPGAGEPYGFGYKYPDRVKLEYLQFPFDRAKELVTVEEVDAYAYYERNKDQFIIPKTPAVPTPDPTPSGPTTPPKNDEKAPPKSDEKAPPKTDEKTQPKTNETPAPKSDEKPAPKTDEKPAPKAEDKPAPKTEEKPAPKEEGKSGCAPGDEVKDDATAKEPAQPTKDAKAETKTEPKTDAKADSKTDVKQPEVKTESKTDAKTDAKQPDTKTSDKSDAKDAKTTTPPTTAPLREPVTPPATTTPATDGPPQYRPYEEVRARIISDLKDQRARELVRKMALDAQEILFRDIRKLSMEDGYYKVDTAKLSLTPLTDVANEIQKRHKMLPTVVRLDANWLTQDEVSKLPDFGDAIVTGVPNVMGARVSDYVFSTRELLEKDSKNRLAPQLRLQAGVPSQPVTDFSSLFIFRVIDATKAASPTYEDRKDDVDRDARKLAAYRILQEKKADLIKRAKAEKIEDIATSMTTTVFSPTFRRREMDMRGRGWSVPTVQPIGQSETLVEEVFEVATKSLKDGTLAGVPAADRIGAAPVDKRMSLVVFRVDLFKPITKSELDRMAAEPYIGGVVAMGLTALDEDTENPLSEEALAKRTGFVRENGGKEEKKDDKAEPAKSSR